MPWSTGQDRHVARAAEPAVADQRLQVAQHLRRSVGVDEDAIDHVGSRKVEVGLVDALGRVAEELVGVVTEQVLDVHPGSPVRIDASWRRSVRRPAPAHELSWRMPGSSTGGRGPGLRRRARGSAVKVGDDVSFEPTTSVARTGRSGMRRSLTCHVAPVMHARSGPALRDRRSSRPGRAAARPSVECRGALAASRKPGEAWATAPNSGPGLGQVAGPLVQVGQRIGLAEMVLAGPLRQLHRLGEQPDRIREPALVGQGTGGDDPPLGHDRRVRRCLAQLLATARRPGSSGAAPDGSPRGPGAVRCSRWSGRRTPRAGRPPPSTGRGGTAPGRTAPSLRRRSGTSLTIGARIRRASVCRSLANAVAASESRPSSRLARRGPTKPVRSGVETGIRLSWTGSGSLGRRRFVAPPPRWGLRGSPTGPSSIQISASGGTAPRSLGGRGRGRPRRRAAAPCRVTPGRIGRSGPERAARCAPLPACGPIRRTARTRPIGPDCAWIVVPPTSVAAVGRSRGPESRRLLSLDPRSPATAAPIADVPEPFRELRASGRRPSERGPEPRRSDEPLLRPELGRSVGMWVTLPFWTAVWTGRRVDRRLHGR